MSSLCYWKSYEKWSIFLIKVDEYVMIFNSLLILVFEKQEYWKVSVFSVNIIIINTIKDLVKLELNW